MAQFAVKTRHDSGFFRLLVIAETRDDAIKLVMNAEGCPRCAIVSAEPTKPLNPK